MIARSRAANAGRVSAVAAALIAFATGCGGGSPLMHSARALSSGDLRVAAGVSANVATGSLANDLQKAQEIALRDPEAPGAPGSSPDYAKGALVAAAIAPGLAPFASGRIGVGNRFEGGLSYTGRGVRVDMRRSFDSGGFSFSAGLGLSAALYGRQQGSDLPNVALAALHGYGADAPLLVGWQSAGGVYMLWTGARGGFEHVDVSRLTTEPKDVTIGGAPIDLAATRYYGGAVVGLATGFRHVHVALEMNAAYQVVSGSYNATNVTIRGITVAPATALWWTF